MALETLKGVNEIGEFYVIRGKPEGITWDEFDVLREDFPIHITDDKNLISFKIQNGAIKENGVNGCQVDTIIEAAMLMLMGLNEKFPCRENSMAITKLDEALLWLLRRKINREKRGVEGTSNL